MRPLHHKRHVEEAVTQQLHQPRGSPSGHSHKALGHGAICLRLVIPTLHRWLPALCQATHTHHKHHTPHHNTHTHTHQHTTPPQHTPHHHPSLPSFLPLSSCPPSCHLFPYLPSSLSSPILSLSLFHPLLKPPLLSFSIKSLPRVCGGAR